jgi:SecD/SecF fusion protein
MNKELRWKFAVVLGVLGISLWFAIPWERPFPKHVKMRLGLDLQGGTEILYRLAFEKLTPDQRRDIEGKDPVGRIINIIETRVNAHGLKEFKLRKYGEDKILIQLPGRGEEETKDVTELIETSGKLEFRFVAEQNEKKGMTYPQAPPNMKWLDYAKSSSERGRELVIMQDSWNFTGEYIKSAGATQDDRGFPAISFTITRGGQDLFGDMTGNNIEKRLAIIMDERIISAPAIKATISDNGIITGDFTLTEQERLITVLQTGTFPVDLVFESKNFIGPSIGHDSITKGMRAMVIAGILVLAFILVYYMGVGAVANFALLFNLAIVLGFMTLFQATMTLPGIAGMLLTVGMAVDANILIYERIREEKAKGKTLAQSVKNGYDRAFITILDANLTTLFTAGILFLVGTGPVKGFAVTMSIGILASMFTALFATRAIFEALIAAKVVTEFRMFSIIKKPNFQFIRMSPKAVMMSMVLIFAGLLLFAYRGEKNLGVDFRDGTLIDFNLTDPLPIGDVRSRLHGFETKDDQGRSVRLFAQAEVQEMWEVADTGTAGSGSAHFQVRTSHAGQSQKLKEALFTLFAKELVPSFVSNETITPNQYIVSFSFSFASEAGLRKVRGIFDAEQNLFNGTLTSDGDRSYAKTFHYESDFAVLDTDRLKAQAEIDKRIRRVRGLLSDEFEIEGDFPAGLEVTTYADLSLCVNLGTKVEASLVKEIIKPFPEVQVMPDTGKASTFTLSTNRFKSLAVQNPFEKRIKDWKIQLKREFSERGVTLAEPISRTTDIGKIVASEMTERATWAIILSLIVVILYVAFRFHLGGSSPYSTQAGLGAFSKDLVYRARFGFAAVAALTHDVLITLGAIAFFSWAGIVEVQIDLQILAAFLTIIGYSLNDTIVVFDRIRENVGSSMGKDFAVVVNESINNTLSRTILTSATTFVVVLMLFIFGGRIIRGFSFALLIGVIVGTYSSVFIAAPMLVYWERIVRKVKPAPAKEANAKA